MAGVHMGVTTHLHNHFKLMRMQMRSLRGKCAKPQYGARKSTFGSLKMKPASYTGSTITCMMFFQAGHTQVALSQVEDIIVTQMKINRTWACCNVIHVNNVFVREQYRLFCKF